MPKLTSWFPPDDKPVHIGSYETRRSENDLKIYPCWWDGQGWLLDECLHRTPRFTLKYSDDQNRPWRGLKVNPLLLMVPRRRRF